MAPLQNTYFWLRHGHSKANQAGIICSLKENGIKQDYKLSEQGIEQAKAGGEAFKKMLDGMPKQPVVFVSSPFSRAKETGTIVASAVGIPESQIKVTDDIMERGFGKDLELQPAAENYKKIYTGDEASNGAKAPGNVETAASVAERVMRAVQAIEAKHKGAIVVLSAHGDVCTIGAAAMMGAPLGSHFKSPLANCELRKVN